MGPLARGRRRVVHQLPSTLPPDVLHVGWTPLARLLPRTAGLVHHGGIGTLAHAIRAGVPQLIVPFAHDQPDNANRVRALGIAERLDRRRFTAERAARALDGLLGDVQVRARCAVYAARVDFARAAEEACDVIEAAAHGGSDPAPPGPAPPRMP
ncbi:glycosyltransferase [Georgenia sp. AZ-5]|uniref:glycosyltransferase n=1 Tax=Georgenia sp. AZ-5 TaxID=3367526 RepID=UPI0037542DD2